MAKKVQVIVFHHEGEPEVLLLRMKADRANGIQNVTGSVDEGESFEIAAKRELFEETGIDATPSPLDLEFKFHDRWDRDVIEKVFYLKLDKKPKAVTISNEEHEGFLWQSLEKVSERTYLHPSNYEAFILAKQKLVELL